MRCLRWLHGIEDALLVLVLLGMIGLAVLQILLRNLADTGLVWADPLLQNGVLWIGMLGAMIATRRDEHIRIDLASRYLPGWARRLTSILVDLFTAGVCLTVAGFCVAALREEAAVNGDSLAGIPVWVLQGILPLGFTVIGLRYVLLLILNLLGRRPQGALQS